MPKDVTHNLAEVNRELRGIKTVVIGDTLYFGDTIPVKLSDALEAEGALIMREPERPLYSGGPPFVRPELAYDGGVSGWKVDADVIRDKFPGIEVADAATIGDPVEFLKERGLLGKKRDRSEGTGNEGRGGGLL
jgi:hypothetical protein